MIETTISQMENTGVIEISPTESYKLQHHINPAEGLKLRDWVVKVGAKKTVEIGMGTGISGLYLCWGLAQNGGGKHLAIDPFQDKGFWNSRGLKLRDKLGMQ